jgi:tripartite-type tricarboxylate transporter receptor subunit TctC
LALAASLTHDLMVIRSTSVPLSTTPLVLYAKKTMPAKDLAELIAWLKANPNRAAVGIYTAGINLVTAMFQKEAGMQFTFVPYRGAAPAMQDLVAGQIDLTFTSLDQLPLVRAGSIKAYAVTGDTRFAAAPDIPTFGEMGLPAISGAVWFRTAQWCSRAGRPAQVGAAGRSGDRLCDLCR